MHEHDCGVRLTASLGKDQRRSEARIAAGQRELHRPYFRRGQKQCHEEEDEDDHGAAGLREVCRPVNRR
jgi:hypothetical protein